MMLLHSSMAPQQILPAALTHIESSIQISQAELQLKKYHFFGSAAFEYYLPLEIKCRDKETFAKFILCGLELFTAIMENYQHQFCLAPSLYQLLGKCFVLEDCKILFPILCKFSIQS